MTSHNHAKCCCEEQCAGSPAKHALVTWKCWGLGERLCPQRTVLLVLRFAECLLQQATFHSSRALWHAQRIVGELFLFMDLCGSLLSSLRL